jgi:hypothetical protein
MTHQPPMNFKPVLQTAGDGAALLRGRWSPTASQLLRT